MHIFSSIVERVCWLLKMTNRPVFLIFFITGCSKFMIWALARRRSSLACLLIFGGISLNEVSRALDQECTQTKRWLVVLRNLELKVKMVMKLKLRKLCSYLLLNHPPRSWDWWNWERISAKQIQFTFVLHAIGVTKIVSTIVRQPIECLMVIFNLYQPRLRPVRLLVYHNLIIYDFLPQRM